MEIKQLLQEHYGYTTFREGQQELIEGVLAGRDCLGIMPTGGGKSLCYQLPSLVLDGVTIVVSPLISLMKDQVDALDEMGIPSTFINSSLDFTDYKMRLSGIRNGRYKLLYIAPERLENEYFRELIQSVKIACLAVDEAHCISQWGHDFRTSYRKIPQLIELTGRYYPVIAFTATATDQVREDIVSLLQLKDPLIKVTGFDRKNLFFGVERPKDKFIWLRQHLNVKESAIIYASTRKKVDELYNKLTQIGFPITRYHAGLSEEERAKNQEDFIYDRLPIMVATNAFGMGIDKSTVRQVIHYNMPKNLESYYQEAGRAGRDGEDANAILLYSSQDIIINKYLINQGSTRDQFEKLNQMINYCYTGRCLRQNLLGYFGESAPDDCGKCSNCTSEQEMVDITVETQKILSCIYRMDQRFGMGKVIEVLRGRQTKGVKQFRFEKLSTFGIMKQYSEATIREIIGFLTAEAFINVTGGDYPLLKLAAKAASVLYKGEKVHMRQIHVQTKETSKEIAYDLEVFDVLRGLRKEIASAKGVPPFIIFGDVSLKAMARTYPTTPEEFMTIPGVGELKLKTYGDTFINAIADYLKDHEKMVFLDGEQPTQRMAVSAERKITTTALTTYSYYQKGLTIPEIATERELAETTIEGHLVTLIKEGYDIDLDRFIPIETQHQIIDAIRQEETRRLTPIKEKLPDVSFAEIRLVMTAYYKEE